MAQPVKAEQIGFFFNGVLIGCAQSAEINISRETLNAACAATGNWASPAPGQMSYEGSVEAVLRAFIPAEVEGNVNFPDVFDIFVEGATVEMRFGIRDGLTADQIAALNGWTLAGDILITELSFSYDPEDNQTWSFSYNGVGPLVRTAPTPAV